MRTHEEFAALLDPFVDGELSPEDMQAVQQHLTTCPDCQAYVDDALAIRAAFPTVEETPVPADFVSGVMGVIQAQPAPVRKKKQPWGKVLLPVAACFAVVLVLKTAVPPERSESEAPAPEAVMEFRMADAAAPEEVPAQEEAAAYFTQLTLTAEEAGDLLKDFQPVDETEDACHYRLTASEYDRLLTQLAEREVLPISEDTAADNSQLALVTVLK